jgi:hypothetical protein
LRKINLILILLLLGSSCSIIKKGDQTDNRLLSGSETEKVIKNLAIQNITKNNFFIQKAEVEIASKQLNGKLIGSIKYKRPGTYLISLKSRSGIEALRIFISKDTILINDRINQKLLCASSDYLSDKYGISASVFGLVLGDYIVDSIVAVNDNQCVNGKLDLTGETAGIRMKYVIDCKLSKIISAGNVEGITDRRIEIRFDDFRKVGNVLAPGKIEIKDIKTESYIIIEIKKVEYPWNGILEFIPGNRYEITDLL